MNYTTLKDMGVNDFLDMLEEAIENEETNLQERWRLKKSGMAAMRRQEPDSHFAWLEKRISFMKLEGLMNYYVSTVKNPENLNFFDFLKERKNWDFQERKHLDESIGDPFDFLSGRLKSRYDLHELSFTDFLDQEMEEAGDLSSAARDIEAISVEVQERRNDLVNHPWFTESQVAVALSYLDGAHSGILTEKDELAAISRLNECDPLFRCCMAVCDQDISSETREHTLRRAANLVFELSQNLKPKL